MSKQQQGKQFSEQLPSDFDSSEGDGPAGRPSQEQ